MVLSFLAPACTPLAYAASHRNVSLPLLLLFRYLANNHLSGTLPAAISQLENLEQIWLDNNNIEGPLPPGMCSLPWLWRLDVSGNSLYGRINRDFKNMLTTSGGALVRTFDNKAGDDNALVNLAHNFFFGDGVLFAAGCKVCPTEINEPNNLGIRDSFAWQEFGGKCGSLALVDERGKTARVSLSGNCLTLTPSSKCSVNATQRSTVACQAFCSITDNGPCDGHGACVPAAPASPSSFTCLLSSLSTGAIVGIVLGSFAGFTLLASMVAWLLWPRGQKKWEGLDVCEQFSLQQMLSATNNWSEDNVLGKGGFGVVYKGRSPQGQLWAIKRSTIMTNDFETEVRAMASLHHVHLVRLLGFCLDQNVETGKQEQILVYEFMANRDLEYHIHRTKRPLSLRQRLCPAMKLVETYEVEELRDSKMPAVSEEAIVDFADLALDCIKSPGTRRPTMKDVAYRLSALIDKHCPDEEDEWENVVTEEGTSNQGMPSELCGGGGREPERSHGSQSGVISFTGTFSMTDSLKSWLQLKPSIGR
ncbi:unnamed protein product [Closterium sp. NIES-65]|nr:unnamed protein product [Closterium sp. NIES-65]